VRMRILSWDMFLGYLTGAGFIYVAMLLINSITETTFIWSKFFFEFFLFWDFVFGTILLAHWLLDKL